MAGGDSVELDAIEANDLRALCESWDRGPASGRVAGLCSGRRRKRAIVPDLLGQYGRGSCGMTPLAQMPTSSPFSAPQRRARPSGSKPIGWRPGFSAGALFLVHEQPVAGFPDMTDLCHGWPATRTCASPVGPSAPRRPTLLPATVRSCPAWRCGDVRPRGTALDSIDIDGLDDPDCFPAEPEDGIEHAIELLPEPFTDASCWWQATGSAGSSPASAAGSGSGSAARSGRRGQGLARQRTGGPQPVHTGCPALRGRTDPGAWAWRTR